MNNKRGEMREDGRQRRRRRGERQDRREATDGGRPILHRADGDPGKRLHSYNQRPPWGFRPHAGSPSPYHRAWLTMTIMSQSSFSRRTSLWQAFSCL